ncbi:histidine acid phosphatase [Chaetomium strumarium]|uniref:Histidine acid phosphatase n=1 Tax=Chaetomium strumarium TaxID=1170767 RepID=A0AAJ0GWG6_9PEZI|nr:histidine acid phosphatase [Chaetomium strumarium]
MKPVVVSLAIVAAALAEYRHLAPPQDILIDTDSETASNPLQWLGANSPWFAGPNVNGIDPEVPEDCYVEQAAYAVRHGSRYPDQGAYNGWVSMQQRFAPENGYTASGSLSFLPKRRTVVTNPPMQIAMESPTGYKESYDLGYTLRTRYPDLYNDGQYFPVWANNYTRVLQTAQMFVRGYLGPFAPTYGNVVSVTAKGFVGAVGDSLAPSDMCPNFVDTSGATQQAVWAAVFVPPIRKRLQAMITGNLTLTDGDITQIPYLCGFESQITGRLSPWCDVFTDDELKSYQYYNDLRYYYGLGPGTDLPTKMMTPFVNSLVGLLAQGPNVTGTLANGTTFALPKLLMAFMNDGQINEIADVIGVFDDQAPLDPSVRDDGRLYMVSRFSTMRGTIAFERLNCVVEDGSDDHSSRSSSSSSSSTILSTVTRGSNTTTTTTATIMSSLTGTATHLTTTVVRTVTTTVCPTPTPTAATLLPRTSNNTRRKNDTFIRIRLNDAVYPVPSCKNGPGSSCPVSDYAAYIAKKYAAQGDWVRNCNVTLEGAPTAVRGASFFTDLSQPWLQDLKP